MDNMVPILVVLAIYLIPTITAYNRRHKDKLAIFALNFLLGFTAIGWLVALVWSLTGRVEVAS